MDVGQSHPRWMVAAAVTGISSVTSPVLEVFEVCGPLVANGDFFIPQARAIFGGFYHAPIVS